jgi:hypothetical protein
MDRVNTQFLHKSFAQFVNFRQSLNGNVQGKTQDFWWRILTIARVQFS